MKVLVCGGRDYGNLARLKGNRKDPEWIQKEREYRHIMGTLNRMSLEWPKTPEDEYGNWLPDVTIISGAAQGVDSVAIDWAVVNWQKCEEYPADWKAFGKLAGIKRNEQMLLVGQPDLVVAFPGGSGTADMVRRAKRAKIKVIEIKEGEEWHGSYTATAEGKSSPE